MFSYFSSAFAAEPVAGHGLPWTTLRATEFHDSHFMVVRQLAKLPVIPVVFLVRNSSRSMRAMSRINWLPSHWVRRPGWRPTSPGRACTRWPTWSGHTCRPVGKHRARLPIWLPGKAAAALQRGAALARNGPWAVERGKISSC